MSMPIPPIKTILADAIQLIRDHSAEEDAQEDVLISESRELFSDVVDEDDSDDNVPQVFSLKDVPIDEWGGIVLSEASVFSDRLWDFTSYPHLSRKQLLVNFAYENKLGINLIDPVYKHWERICKMLLFYCVPHFAVSNYIRSYGSLNTKKTRIIRLLALFQQERLYIGDFGDEGFRTINDLSEETIDNFIFGRSTASAKWELAHTIYFWQKLSVGELIPTEYSATSRYVSREDVRHYRAEYDATYSPYLPIALDDYSNILNHCIQFIEDYSQDIVWLYDTYYPTVVGGFQYPERLVLKPEGVSSSSPEGVDAFKRYRPVMRGGRAWWGLAIVKRESLTESKAKPWGYVPSTTVASLIGALIDACTVTILASTGMRRSEVMGLCSDCLEHDTEGFWLRYTVFKTSKASQGDPKRIPVPELTAKALTLIERVCRESRLYGKHEYLFSSLHRGHFGCRVAIDHPERAAKRVAEAAGVDEGIHPHRFRKTLAMYLIYQDPKNIEIIRQLFSHVSLKMTLRYIISLPGVNNEIKRIIVEQNVDVLLEVLEGAINGRIAGEAGKRIRKSVEESATFAARLQDKGKEGLIQYVESMLEHGIKILHRTNLAICMKTPGYIETAPCDGKNEDASTKFHPNLFACDPFGCRFAAFVESNISDLRNEVVFHERLINHVFTGEDQRKFSQRRIDAVMKRLDELGEVDKAAKELING